MTYANSYIPEVLQWSMTQEAFHLLNGIHTFSSCVKCPFYFSTRISVDWEIFLPMLFFHWKEFFFVNALVALVGSFGNLLFFLDANWNLCEEIGRCVSVFGIRDIQVYHDLYCSPKHLEKSCIIYNKLTPTAANQQLFSRKRVLWKSPRTKNAQ